MNYGIILASGKGTRVKDGNNLPKQFRLINNKPIIIYTLLKFLKIKKFDLIYVCVAEEYLDYTTKLIDNYIENKSKIKITCGGKERIDTITNAINAIIKDNGCGNDDIVVIHDAVRPFVTDKILIDSIEGAKKYNAVVCAIPMVDTLLFSKNKNVVEQIPNRDYYYKGQAPDSFKLPVFVELLNKLSKEERKNVTGTSQICTMNNYPIHMIEGDEQNFKITTKSDFILAESMIKGSDIQ